MADYPVVYGYVRTSTDRPEAVAALQEEVRGWCAKAGWHLGAIFTDVGAALDAEERIGFGGLLDALGTSTARAAVVIDPSHLSSNPEVVISLVNQIRRTGSALVCRTGALPEAAQKLCQGQPSLSH